MNVADPDAARMETVASLAIAAEPWDAACKVLGAALDIDPAETLEVLSAAERASLAASVAAVAAVPASPLSMTRSMAASEPPCALTPRGRRRTRRAEDPAIPATPFRADRAIAGTLAAAAAKIVSADFVKLADDAAAADRTRRIAGDAVRLGDEPAEAPSGCVIPRPISAALTDIAARPMLARLAIEGMGSTAAVSVFAMRLPIVATAAAEAASAVATRCAIAALDPDAAARTTALPVFWALRLGDEELAPASIDRTPLTRAATAALLAADTALPATFFSAGAELADAARATAVRFARKADEPAPSNKDFDAFFSRLALLEEATETDFGACFERVPLLAEVAETD